MVVAVVLAGGIGQRLKADIPKQFIEVRGKPIIVHTLEKLQAHNEIDHILVVCVKDYISEVSSYKERFGIHKLFRILPGGETFQDSTMSAVYGLQDFCKYDDIFLLHPAISPMTSSDLISDSIMVSRKYGNAFAADENHLLLCEKTGPNSSDKKFDRDKIYGLNFPWSWRYGQIIELYEQAKRDNMDMHSEPHMPMLMISMGKPIYFSESATSNLKITTKDDIDIFECYLILKERRNTYGFSKRIRSIEDSQM